MSEIRSEKVMLDTIDENRGWFIALGMCLILLGIVALAFPFLTTIVAKSVLGWVFLIGGIAQVVHAFSRQGWSAFLLDLLLGVLYVIAGAWLAFFPLTGIFTLTLLIAVTMIVHGILAAAMAFSVKPRAGWGWLLFSGILSAILGVVIMMKLPGSATWIIGALVGINLVFSGSSYVALATVPRKAGEA